MNLDPDPLAWEKERAGTVFCFRNTVTAALQISERV